MSTLEILVANLGKGSQPKNKEDTAQAAPRAITEAEAKAQAEAERQKKLKIFFETLETRPGFILAQEIQSWGIDCVTESLKQKTNIDYLHCKVLEYGTSLNAIIWNKNFTVKPHTDVWNKKKLIPIELEACNEFQISSRRFRFAVLTRGRSVGSVRSVLIVNYHGERNGISDKERVSNFLVCLKLFQDFKEMRKCKYLVIAGDFNFDLDQFDLQHDQYLDEKYKLKVVPYESQRLRKNQNGDIVPKVKFDGLICSKELWEATNEVVVYHYSDRTRGGGASQMQEGMDYAPYNPEDDNAPDDEEGARGGASEAKKTKNPIATDRVVPTGKTRVVASGIPQKDLDHDPIFFKLSWPR
jgi:hypothetical protein